MPATVLRIQGVRVTVFSPAAKPTVAVSYVIIIVPSVPSVAAKRRLATYLLDAPTPPT